MELSTRRIIFWALLAAFLIISPLLIGYALGFVFNFKTRALERTGGIFIKSKTPVLSVFLNHEFKKETSLISGGALLTDLAPATYLLTLKKEGYAPWSKAVTVDEGRVIELRDVLLLKNPVDIRPPSADEIRALRATKKNSSVGEKIVLDNRGTLFFRTATSTERIAENVHSFGMRDETELLFVDKSGFLTKRSLEDATVEIIGRPGFYLKEAPISFFVSPKNDVLLLDASGGLFMLGRERDLSVVEGGVHTVSFDSTGEKALLVKRGTLEVLWLETNPYQPFQKRGDRETIMALSHDILNAGWFFFDDAHIVFRTGMGIYFVELDGRGGRNTVELVSGPTDELITDPAFPRTIFFKKDGTLQKIEL